MTKDYDVNLVQDIALPVVKLSQYDVGVVLAFDLFNGSTKATIDSVFGSAPDEVNLVGTKPSGIGFTIPALSSGLLRATATLDLTSEYGRFPAELEFKKNDDVIGTANFWVEVEESPHKDGTIDGYDEGRSIIEQIVDIELAAEADASRAEGYAARAEAAAERAEQASGEPNVIESISVNGVTQPVINKNVNLQISGGGGEPNVIESISVNGVNVQPVNKNVNLQIEEPTITTIKVNGVTQPITNKTVNLQISGGGGSGYHTLIAGADTIETAMEAISDGEVLQISDDDISESPMPVIAYEITPYFNNSLILTVYALKPSFDLDDVNDSSMDLHIWITTSLSGLMETLTHLTTVFPFATKTSDLTNDAGFLTLATLPVYSGVVS